MNHTILTSWNPISVGFFCLTFGEYLFNPSIHTHTHTLVSLYRTDFTQGWWYWTNRDSKP